jgi:hypothetical protein
MYFAHTSSTVLGCAARESDAAGEVCVIGSRSHGPVPPFAPLAQMGAGSSAVKSELAKASTEDLQVLFLYR